jgi:hypothetical protein
MGLNLWASAAETSKADFIQISPTAGSLLCVCTCFYSTQELQIQRKRALQCFRSGFWIPLAMRPVPIPPLFPPVLLVSPPIPPLCPPVPPVSLGSLVRSAVPLVSGVPLGLDPPRLSPGAPGVSWVLQKYPLELLESSGYNSFSRRGRWAWL